MIYDISPEISEDIDVWPNDTPFTHNEICSTQNGDPVTLSKINTTLHLGAHTDAPNHYSFSKLGISEVNIEPYIGIATVIDVRHSNSMRIYPSDIKQDNFAERVLLKTMSFPNPKNWNNDFKACSAELITYLFKKNVKLIGIDTPSIDLYDDKKLESHSMVYKYNMAILEGIILDHIPEGDYELIALPLKLKNADASPVRAILRDL